MTNQSKHASAAREAVIAALIFSIFFLLGCTNEDRANSAPENSHDSLTKTGGAERTSFWRDSVATIDLKIPDSSEARLRNAPRAFARSSIRHQQTSVNVSVKLKGSRSFRPFDDKPAFQLRLQDRPRTGPLAKMARLSLNNMVEDPTLIREALGYWVFRRAGVASPRTRHVQLSVNGVSKGLYVAIESIVPTTDKGSRPVAGITAVIEAEYGCDFDPSKLDACDVKHGGAAALERFATIASSPHLLGDPRIDWNSVTSFLAVSAVVSDFDGYRHSHNVFFVENRSADAEPRWSLVPWGIDRTFKKRMPIFESEGVLARACFADADCRQRFKERVRALVTKSEIESLGAEAKRLEDSIAGGSVSKEKAVARRALAGFLAGRRVEVLRELDGDRAELR